MPLIPESVQKSIDSARIFSPIEMLLRLMGTAKDEQATPGNMACIAEQYPALARRILSVANSSAPRQRRELKSPQASLIVQRTCLIQAIYRTKPISDTTQRGIGLSVVGSLAKREGILITCRSQIGAGTSIALLIPKNRTATPGSGA